MSQEISVYITAMLMTLWSTLMYLPLNIKHIQMDKLMRDGRKEGVRRNLCCRHTAEITEATSLSVHHRHVLVTEITGFCDCAISTVYEEPHNLSIMRSDEYLLNFFPFFVLCHMPCDSLLSS